ncbi:hypothetical protein NHH73_09875 [Oxalobacteraceae bacterium OTU3CINTB1]|nr:hypothetical protein NHH73_09875 [Oxalobacteraceae bacterium OTU3CINTB1]
MTDKLDENATDYVVSATKSALGMVPFAGSLLAELAGSIIPKQRMDRLIDYARKLEHRLSALDQDAIRIKLSDENFTDLLEESARQAAQAITDERREYLAALLASGVSEDRVSFVESRHLLRLLSQINDIEVIWLRFYSHRTLNGDNEFRNKHAAILAPIRTTLGSDQETIDRKALQDNYTEHLVSLGLLTRPLRIDSKTGGPEFDRIIKSWKTEPTQTTLLGRLLLKYIGLDSR